MSAKRKPRLASAAVPLIPAPEEKRMGSAARHRKEHPNRFTAIGDRSN